MEIKVIRSRRRLRTVSARLDNDTLIVSAPESLPQIRLQKIIDDFKIKFEKKKLKDALDREQNLLDIAAGLNAKYFQNKLKINSIEYVTGQNSQFGYCNYQDANIRISHRVGFMPEWVRNYVLIHEMAHLVVPDHSKAFWEIVNRYKLAERARGYLMAIGLEKAGDHEQGGTDG